MGDQHRSDSDREEQSARGTAPARGRDRREAEDARFDPAHAETQHAFHAKSDFASPTVPAKTVGAVGDMHLTRLDEAIAAKSATQVIGIVREMDTQTRRDVADKLSDFAAFMTAREILTVGELLGAPPAQTLLAAMTASPPATRAQVRAFAGDLGTSQLDDAFKNPELTPVLRAKFPGSPLELMPQLGDDGALHAKDLLTWLIETTPSRTVARLMLDQDPKWVSYQAYGLDALGEAGWKWLDAVDATLAAVTNPHTLSAFKRHAQGHAARVTRDDPQVDDAAHVAKLEGLEKSAAKDAGRTAAAVTTEARNLRARRAEVIAKSSPLEIQRQLQHARLDETEQLSWILDKPGLTAAQLREVTTVIEIDRVFFSPKMVTTLRTKFPKVNPEELFSGGVPKDLAILGARDASVAKWLLDGATPETTLRFVTESPEMIDEWCGALVQLGIGFGWVQQLGGMQNDFLLRRLALKCPDVPTVKYIEERLLGTDPNPGTTKAAPIAAPDAYTSARAHLDKDLDDAAKQPKATTEAQRFSAEKRSVEVAADLGELKPDEREALRHDVNRLQQVLATATQQTFPQILDVVQPELQVLALAMTPKNLRVADYIAYAQTRPAREVIMALGSDLYVQRIQKVVELGPFEVFPPLATADVVGQVLRKNPGIIGWMMTSEPATVLRAFAAPTVLDAAVHALGTLDDIEAIDRWPSAAALGPSGKSAYVQLSARAKGALKEALDGRLKATLPPAPASDEEAELPDDADANALDVRGTGPLGDRLKQLLDRGAPAASLLAVLRDPQAVPTLVATPSLVNAVKDVLEVAPDTALHVPLASLLAHRALHEWLFARTPPLRVLSAVTPAVDEAVAASLQNAQLANVFLDALPRGRGLSSANKTTLHRVAKLVKDDERFATLFAATYDSPARDLSREELEKLWSTLELLPHAHVDQKSISRFSGMAKSPDGTTAGVYWPEDQRIDLQSGNLGTKTAVQYDHSVVMTEDEAITTVGSKADLDRMVSEKRMEKHDDGTYSFVYIDQIELYSHTILHEVGHAVDYMLGAQTELVYELAGWNRFQHGDFDGWAASLGGWDLVTAPDKKEISKAWISWLAGGAKGTLSDLVGSDHPAVATKYAKVGVVELASQEINLSFTPTNGLYAMASHSKQAWMTISQKGYNASPSNYALSAPEEYFAECYANYYRELTTAPTGNVTKGATLVPWIKNWFDTNVDKAGHNPKRTGRR